jgi:hypothetical protein
LRPAIALSLPLVQPATTPLELIAVPTDDCR